MQKPLSRLLVISAVIGVFGLAGLGNVFAAKPGSGPTIPLGNDISWPQCNKPYPTGQAFGIVGLNNGLANNSNPCFTSELSWAQQSKGTTVQDKAAIYVNTANPGLAGTFWPDSNSYNGTAITNPYGTCHHDDTAACAYIYGYAKANDDATIRDVISPSSYTWWLDVETTNSWETNKVANAADLEGMVAYFKSINVKAVGLYSTGYQWGEIVGQTTATSNLNYLSSWLAGATSQKGAQANCSLPALTTGGKVTLTQYVANRLDYNYSCI
ncbi:MAG: hypothetical protein QFB87_01865 [Patescibacteria group bacterium]|nr:hypothetical protein [Patescibacteria group bacterium]